MSEGLCALSRATESAQLLEDEQKLHEKSVRQFASRDTRLVSVSGFRPSLCHLARPTFKLLPIYYADWIFRQTGVNFPAFQIYRFSFNSIIGAVKFILDAYC